MAIKKQERVFNFLKDNTFRVDLEPRLKDISCPEHSPKKYFQRLDKRSFSNFFLCHQWY